MTHLSWFSEKMLHRSPLGLCESDGHELHRVHDDKAVRTRIRYNHHSTFSRRKAEHAQCPRHAADQGMLALVHDEMLAPFVHNSG